MAFPVPELVPGQLRLCRSMKERSYPRVMHRLAHACVGGSLQNKVMELSLVAPLEPGRVLVPILSLLSCTKAHPYMQKTV